MTMKRNFAYMGKMMKMCCTLKHHFCAIWLCLVFGEKHIWSKIANIFITWEFTSEQQLTSAQRGDLLAAVPSH